VHWILLLLPKVNNDNCHSTAPSPCLSYGQFSAIAAFQSELFGRVQRVGGIGWLADFHRWPCMWTVRAILSTLIRCIFFCILICTSHYFRISLAAIWSFLVLFFQWTNPSGLYNGSIIPNLPDFFAVALVTGDSPHFFLRVYDPKQWFWFSSRFNCGPPPALGVGSAEALGNCGLGRGSRISQGCG
jgi:hypothetical protein